MLESLSALNCRQTIVLLAQKRLVPFLKQTLISEYGCKSSLPSLSVNCAERDSDEGNLDGTAEKLAELDAKINDLYLILKKVNGGADANYICSCGETFTRKHAITFSYSVNPFFTLPIFGASSHFLMRFTNKNWSFSVITPRLLLLLVRALALR
jgi:hypothetical protein